MNTELNTELNGQLNAAPNIYQQILSKVSVEIAVGRYDFICNAIGFASGVYERADESLPENAHWLELRLAGERIIRKIEADLEVKVDGQVVRCHTLTEWLDFQQIGTSLLTCWNLRWDTQRQCRLAWIDKMIEEWAECPAPK